MLVNTWRPLGNQLAVAVSGAGNYEAMYGEGMGEQGVKYYQGKASE